MIQNYLKIAIRILIRNKWHSLLNILGLSIGIACFIYIYFLLKHELEYDRFHKDIDRVYRICQKGSSTEGESYFPRTQQLFSDYIKDNNESIEHIARFAPNRETQISYKDKQFIDGPTQFVEEDIFKIIDLPFALGDKDNCLKRPFTAVITKKIADKYFGDENPIGKMLKIDTVYYEVTGVLKKLPDNTRFKLDFYLSWSTYANTPSEFPHIWRFLQTYVKLQQDADPKAFEKSIKDLPLSLKDKNMSQVDDVSLFIQALQDIHLNNDYEFIRDWEVTTSKAYVNILMATGLFILIISALNYINLSTTRYTTRYREVALKKTLGATKNMLIRQFIGESVLLVFIAHILGMFIIEFGIQFLNKITQYSFVVDYTSGQLWLVLLSIIILVGVVAGSYPAFYMSSFSPALIQSGSVIKNKRFSLKSILVIIQFSISIVLIIGTLMIEKQVNYMKNKPLGFLKENKVIIELPGNDVNPGNYLLIKDEFKKYASIEATAISSSVPGRWRYNWRLSPTGEEQANIQLINCMQVDYDYFKVYGLEMIIGDPFNDDLSDETNRGYIFNEQAIQKFGWSSPEEAVIKTMFARAEPIRGVMKDFHSKGLQNQIEPLGIFLIAEDYRYLTLQLNNEETLEATLLFLKTKFEELFPDKIFNYFFLNEDFDNQYKSEEKITKLFKIFSVIGILIACIGLFGMSAFICQKREKEIGIRKVNGANAKEIFMLLSKDFSGLIVIAFVIAIPVAYYGTNSWLNNFAYRIHISWFIILLAGIIAWLIAMLTVSYQAIKSARKNPVNSLRNE